jgi:nicotinamide-nucleotide amidase
MEPLHSAELLSIGTELTVGETRDTNAGDLARELTRRGVVVERITALPDDLAAVTSAFADAHNRAHLVISTGGLGPTPDDLTREAIAAFVGETPAVDPALEAWLVELFERRKLPFPDANRKQAWLIPSAVAVPNDNGTAPGWWVERPDGRIIVALPGPPREMRPMWDGWVLPKLLERGLGRPLVSTTLRLTGIGESAIAARLGDLLLAGSRPMVATYARADAVDIRIWTHAEGGDLAAAERLVAAAEAEVLASVGEHVWGRGDATWPGAVAAALDSRGWRLSAIEVGLRGALLDLLGEGLEDRLVLGQAVATREAALPTRVAAFGPAGGADEPAGAAGPAPPDGSRRSLEELADHIRRAGGTEVGLAVEARERGGDTAASVAVVTPGSRHRETRVVFLGGAQGRSRAAVAATAILLSRLNPAGTGES